MGNPIEHAEEAALRQYLSVMDREMWLEELERQGLPHPCDGCEDRCDGKCKFYGVRR
jgi:hypothetical protein